jgi:hypothetical protein
MAFFSWESKKIYTLGMSLSALALVAGLRWWLSEINIQVLDLAERLDWMYLPSIAILLLIISLFFISLFVEDSHPQTRHSYYSQFITKKINQN